MHVCFHLYDVQEQATLTNNNRRQDISYLCGGGCWLKRGMRGILRVLEIVHDLVTWMYT